VKLLQILARLLRREADAIDPQPPPLLVTCCSADAVTVPECGTRYLLMTDGATVANYPIRNSADARRLIGQLADIADGLFRDELTKLRRMRHASPSAN
jgi:uncharacterized iron-regulated protein